MNKKVSPAAFPRLRFSMFRGTSEWQWHAGNELFDSVSNKDHNSDLPVLAITQEQGAVPREQINYHVSVSESSIQNYKIVEIGDFIISLRSFQGGIEYSDYRGLCSPAYIILRKRRDFVSEYFKHYFKSGAYIYALNKNIEGLRDGKMVSYKQFSDISLPLPKLKEEQQKIAECLSYLDFLILDENKQLEKLKAHKRGIMQHLFPVEGETKPKLRFLEFQNEPRWEINSLGKYIEEYREKSTEPDQYEVLTSARSGLVRQREYYDNDSITERINIGFNIIPPEYITYRSRSDDSRFYFNENMLGITGIISSYYPVFRIKGGVNKFFIELFSRYAAFIGQYSVGNAQTVLSMNVLKNIKLPVPTQFEQEKIASCLASIDTKIDCHAKKIDVLKLQKKGLMQQLFPSAEEVVA